MCSIWQSNVSVTPHNSNTLGSLLDPTTVDPTKYEAGLKGKDFVLPHLEHLCDKIIENE